MVKKIDSTQGIISASLTKKAVKRELKNYDKLGHEEYKRRASETLKLETGHGTSASRSNWITYKDTYYPLKMIGRMASLKGGFKEQALVGYWLDGIDSLNIAGLVIVNDTEIEPGAVVTESKFYGTHRRIERRSSARKFVKILGYECKACERKLNPEDGDIWKSTFEVHHLKPFSDLEVGKKRKLSKDDFAVLCSCCHKAIHRTADVSNIEAFKKKHLKHR